MTSFTRISWHPEVTPHNSVVCDDCGSFVYYQFWDQHVTNQHGTEMIELPPEIAEAVAESRAHPEEFGPRPKRPRRSEESV